jgi:hypothetical protein
LKWHIYNQSLVRRGGLLLAFDVIDNCDIELKQMNKYKMKINDIIENKKVQEVNSRSEVWNSIYSLF